MVSILNGLGLDGTIILKQAAAETNKGRLRVNGEEARSRGIFGAPTFLTNDGELFWGNDRLEQALAWAAGDRPGAMRYIDDYAAGKRKPSGVRYADERLVPQVR